MVERTASALRRLSWSQHMPHTVQFHRVLRATPERADACSLGWQESLALLALLVEAELPG